MLAGKPAKLFREDSQALAWMEQTFGEQGTAHPPGALQWAMFRGDESRNAPSTGGQPLLNVRWRQRTTDDRTVEKFVSKLRQDYLSQEIVALPAMHPLGGGRRGADAHGVCHRRPSISPAASWCGSTPRPTTRSSSSSKPAALRSTGQSVQLFSGLDQRMWEDAIYGTLSSDGEQVYFVEDLGLAGVSGSPLRTVLPNGQPRAASMRATPIDWPRATCGPQGKLKWEVGGADRRG